MTGSARPPGHLTVVEAAERIGMHPESLRRAIRNRQIRLTPYSRPSWKARRKYWFPEAAVNAAARARRALQS